jgi:hypothetical protein
VRQVYEAEGWDVIGTTLEGKAAAGLEGSSGIKSKSLASRLYDAQNGRLSLGPKSLLVVDEAGKLNADHFDALFDLIERTGASLAFVGDRQQIQPMGPGAMLRSFEQRLGAALLTKIWRQRDARDAEASEKMFKGGPNAKEALRHYIDAGYVKSAEDEEEAHSYLLSRAVAGYMRDPAQDKTLMAFTNADVAELNRLARDADKMRRDPDLDEDIALTANGKSLLLQAGDRIAVTANNKRLGVYNGETGYVADVNSAARSYTLELGQGDEARYVTLPLQDGPEIAYGYASTIDRMQGVSETSSHLVATKNLNYNRLYVGATRYRGDLAVYVPTSSEKALGYMERIVDRDGALPTTLEPEYGFSPAHASEAAQRSAADEIKIADYVELHAGADATDRPGAQSLGKGTSRARDMLSSLLRETPEREGLAPAAATRAMTDVLMARALDGAPSIEPELRFAAGKLLTEVSDKQGWRTHARSLSRAQRDTSEVVAQRWTGAKDGEEVLPEARALARAIAVSDSKGTTEVSRALKAGLEHLSARVAEARQDGTYGRMLIEAKAPLPEVRELVPEGEEIGREYAERQARFADKSPQKPDRASFERQSQKIAADIAARKVQAPDALNEAMHRTVDWIADRLDGGAGRNVSYATPHQRAAAAVTRELIAAYDQDKHGAFTKERRDALDAVAKAVVRRSGRARAFERLGFGEKADAPAPLDPSLSQKDQVVARLLKDGLEIATRKGGGDMKGWFKAALSNVSARIDTPEMERNREMDVERTLGVGEAGMSMGDEDLVNMAQAITSAVSRHVDPKDPVHEIDNLSREVQELVRRADEQLLLGVSDQVRSHARSFSKMRAVGAVKQAVMRQLDGSIITRNALYRDENPYRFTVPALAQPYEDEVKTRIAKIVDSDLQVERFDLIAAVSATNTTDFTGPQKVAAAAIERAAGYEVADQEAGRLQQEDRAAILHELEKNKARSPDQKAALLERVYQSYTRQEIKGMLDGKLPAGQNVQGKDLDTKTISKSLHDLAGAKLSMTAPHHSRQSLNNLSPQMNAPSMGR